MRLPTWKVQSYTITYSCWSAHARRARAHGQLVVERQYRWSVSYSVIAWADCFVTGGVCGHYNITCTSLVLFSTINSRLNQEYLTQTWWHDKY